MVLRNLYSILYNLITTMKNTQIILRLFFCTILIAGVSYFTIAQEDISDEEILELYKTLRVADVSDGMDMVGLPDVGLMDTRIEALWKDTDDMTHIVRGIAVTARYVPTQKVVKIPMEKEEFQKWEGHWYGNYSTEPFVEHIKDGTILVIDFEGDGDTGSIGSNNSLNYMTKGARGLVSNGGVRDTDEIIKQGIPVYFDYSQRGRGIRPGRNEIESVQKPVSIGGVLINPGDVVVADGDGVIVVPREHARQVAIYAKEILDNDKRGRRALYEKLGLPMDKTVEIDD